MAEYHSLKGSRRQLAQKRLVLICGVIFFIFGIASFSMPECTIGVFLVYIGLYHKYLIINENGLTTEYHLVFAKQKISYSFGDYQSLLVDNSNPVEVRLGFVKKGVTSYAFFSQENSRCVIELFQQQNPSTNVQWIKLRGKF